MKKTIAILLLFLIAFGAVSCGGKTDTPLVTGTSSAADENDTTAETEWSYDYADLDYKGKTFTVLNATTTWGFYTTMVLDELTGEALDDAVFTRNRGIEERYNLVLTTAEYDIQTNYNNYKTAVLAGDNIYDVGYIRCDKMAPFMAEGYVYNLLEIPTIALDMEWWDQTVVKRSLIGDGRKLYFASNDFSLVGFDGTLCVYFNENIAENLGLERPYQLVHDGKWTTDIFLGMMKSGSALNSDDSFAWDEGGTCVYGLVTYQDMLNGFLTGAGESYVTVGADGVPSLVGDNKRFYGVFDKIYKIVSDDTFLILNGSGNSHYEMVFKHGRSFFTVAEIKASSKYRDMDATFGIVPIPKYDEAQEGYYSHRTHVCLTMSIPVTNPDPDSTGIIMDALAYESYTDVLPVYYDVKVSQKGLRNVESIEMLGIISKGRSFDIGEAYGWTEELSETLNTMYVKNKQHNVASTVEANRSKIESLIASTMEYMR